MNIFVDFDKTIAGGHSGGFAMTRRDPMTEENKVFIKSKISDWLSKGNNVIIVTRGVDTEIHSYLTKKLGIKHTMNSFSKGELSVYAPDFDTFHRNGDVEFAILKTEYVDDFLKQSNTKSKDSIFMDDTKINVDKMKEKFPEMECLVAKEGDYEHTVSKIDNILKKKYLGGFKRIKSRKLNNYFRRSYKRIKSRKLN
jgi:hypothetical protein